MAIKGRGSDGEDPIWVPKDTEVHISAYSMHRDLSILGKEVKSFVPERWNHIKPNPWEFMPFMSRPRTCLGQEKASLETAYVLARLAHDFVMVETRGSRLSIKDILLTVKNRHGREVAMTQARTLG